MAALGRAWGKLGSALTCTIFLIFLILENPGLHPVGYALFVLPVVQVPLHSFGEVVDVGAAVDRGKEFHGQLFVGEVRVLEVVDERLALPIVVHGQGEIGVEVREQFQGSRAVLQRLPELLLVLISLIGEISGSCLTCSRRPSTQLYVYTFSSIP